MNKHVQESMLRDLIAVRWGDNTFGTYFNHSHAVGKNNGLLAAEAVTPQQHTIISNLIASAFKHSVGA